MNHFHCKTLIYQEDWVPGSMFASGYRVKLREIGGLNHEYQNNVSWPIIQWFEKIRSS